MSKLSYSFHLSSKSHAVNNATKLNQVNKHNLRKYKSADYQVEKNDILVGSYNLVRDVKKIYQEEFNDMLKVYNSSVRADRQIDDYFEHMSKSSNDMAVEIIIQVGDKDFWSNKGLDYQKKMNVVFNEQLNQLHEYCPELKIASAVVHYDESSPHMHIVGVPIAEGYKKGLKKQVSKSKVFTKDSLTNLQKNMRAGLEPLMQQVYQNPDLQIKEKEDGRNKDYSKKEIEQITQLQKKLESTKRELSIYQEQCTKLDTAISNKTSILNELHKNIELAKNNLTYLDSEKTNIFKLINGELAKSQFVELSTLMFSYHLSIDKLINNNELYFLDNAGKSTLITDDNFSVYHELQTQRQGRLGAFRREKCVKVPLIAFNELILALDRNITLSKDTEHIVSMNSSIQQAHKSKYNDHL